jgi:hypothetical protein
MADPAVAGPGREFHLGDKLRLGPSGILGVPSGDGDEGRGVSRYALESFAVIDRPSGMVQPVPTEPE